MERNYDILAIGECLIDFTPIHSTADGYPAFSQNPGGAPANMITAAAKMGASVAFLGKVGNDQFGHFLRNVLIRQNICIDGLVISDSYKTTLAFVSLCEDGQREFTFYRDPGADQMLTSDEIDFSLIRKTKVLHISSLAYCGDVIRHTVNAVASFAKKEGKLITYDANWRPMLWKDLEEGKRRLADALKYADIIKASEEELVLLTQEEHEAEAVGKLLCSGAKMVVVTKGANGSAIYTPTYHIDIDAFPVKAIDTTGAGDAFFGSFIAQILPYVSVEDISQEQMLACAQYSAAFAAISVTRPGGIPSIPTKEETDAFIKYAFREET